ncbi:hypothetical protein GCM10011533_22650 [Streptosporangium jomthongense]|uniref:DUF6361 family protein n=1 Tax=Marinobacter aromaticivorans TaxID=1494078 RepID=A0ABW2IVP3_9GAMM|nr:DUF6361 family protein [Marinobacter aromaticivorans]GGE69765.1 hypothetical protein GCM10011533_22650 [Streptosporangium jomthongense]
MSSIGWVDFSSTDREKVSQVLAMLQESGTLDELGIGQIRDAFADLLFPGFSTIQTRAKYFITVPRIIRDYMELDARTQRRTSLRDYLESQENEVAKVLVERHGSAESGIIGAEMVESKQGVARKPSSVYWNGLRQFGVVNTAKSLAEFSREINQAQSASRASGHEDDDSDAMSHRSVVHLDVFESGWMEDLTIHLSESEARFLIDKLTHTPAIRNSVVSQFLIHGLASELDEDTATSLTFPEVVAWTKGRAEVSLQCRHTLELANEFSDAIYGAHIRFNALIARKSGNDELLAEHEELFSEWLEEIRDRNLFSASSVDDWLQAATAGGARINLNSREFLRQWHEAIFQNQPVSSLDRLVESRAKRNKGRRSTLFKSPGFAPEWQGMSRLSYRWDTARTIMADIVQGAKC